eukprot:9618-Heterococcus_DN1.PRE.1
MDYVPTAFYGAVVVVSPAARAASSSSLSLTCKVHQLKKQYWQSKLPGLKNGFNYIGEIQERINNKSSHVLNKKSSCSVASVVQTTQSPQPTELLMHCPQVERGHQVQAL